ncbi:MAG: triose-phosphate isomerase [Verrucomicrobiae bacterium]|nr:triose-phosphate isomerase [Verrucomicrobiae bacterium]
MLRKKIIAANWKMNKTPSEGVILTQNLLKQLGDFDRADLVICPPFTSLASVNDLIKGHSHFSLGAQNLFYEKQGAYTGEISADMLRDAGCGYVIIGHSERREYFLETDEIVNRKIKAALAANLKSIVCVGEKLSVREDNGAETLIRNQIQKAFHDLSDEAMNHIIVAYEPVWAIGTGRNATPAQAQEVHNWIRDQIAKQFSTKVADQIRIQYGGSVKPENAKELLNQPDVDGALVGGASLEAASFTAIVKNSVG